MAFPWHPAGVYIYDPVTNAWVPTTPVSPPSDTLLFVSVNQSAAGTDVLAAANATKRHRVYGLMLSLTATGTLQLTGTGPISMLASTPFVMPMSTIPALQTDLNTSLALITTGCAARGYLVLTTQA